MSEEDLIREARGDGANQRNDESLYEAEPAALQGKNEENVESGEEHARQEGQACSSPDSTLDRKSTRLNSSHGYISYAVFCLIKKTEEPIYRKVIKPFAACQ